MVYPDPILSKTTRRLTDEEISSGVVNGAPISKIVGEMVEIMRKNGGVGLAAPQHGLSISLCVIDVPGMIESNKEKIKRECVAGTVKAVFGRHGVDGDDAFRKLPEDEQKKIREEVVAECKVPDYEVPGALVPFKDEPLVLINPEVVETFGRIEASMEGCLSLPGVRINARRPEEVKVTAKRIDGSVVSIKADGFLSRVLQHEIDHCFARLITTRGQITPGANKRLESLEHDYEKRQERTK